MPREHRVVDHIVRHLAGIGVEYIFGVDGANIEDLYDAAYFRSDITAILAKHEFSAATMADGYSRSGAGLGVVAATSGGGALNLIPGLGESFTSRVPVLALVGQPATSMDGLGSFQDTSGRNGSLDAEALFSQASVFCRRILHPRDIIAALPAAIAAARTGGPAVLLLPKDVQQALIDARCSRDVGRKPGVGNPYPIERALRRVTGPVTIIAGEQVARDDARAELAALRGVLRARVACVPDGKDVAGTTGPRFIVGARSNRRHGSSWRRGGGVRQWAVSGGRHPTSGDRPRRPRRCAGDGAHDVHRVGATVLSLHARPHRRLADVVAHADRGTQRRRTAHWSAGARRGRAYRADATAVRRSRGALPRRDGPARPHAAGRCGHRRRRRKHRRGSRSLPAGAARGRFAVALGMGGMGYSFGAGIGMAFARRQTRGPDRRVVVIAGDGAFYMHGMEIHTALHYRLPMTFVLLNNNAHAMCVTREQLYYNDFYSYNRFSPSPSARAWPRCFPS